MGLCRSLLSLRHQLDFSVEQCSHSLTEGNQSGQAQFALAVVLFMTFPDTEERLCSSPGLPFCCSWKLE